LIQGVYLLFYFLDLLSLLGLFKFNTLQVSLSGILTLLLLGLTKFSLPDRQGYNVVVEVKGPFLFSFSLWVNRTGDESFGEFEDLIFGKSDHKKIPLVFPSRGKSQLCYVLKHDTGLGDYVLKFAEVKVLELLDFGVIVESSLVDAYYPFC
jgi:hypothetical protein